MNISIKNISKLPTIDYRKAKPLQGELKDLTTQNYERLKHVLTRRGFEIPLFLWRKADDLYLLDGHQRQRVMSQEDMNDSGSYEVPYVEIHAKDEAEAKAKLLEISSQYGTITIEGFDTFAADLPEAELLESIHFDALSYLHEREADLSNREVDAEGLLDTDKVIICPRCKFEFGNKEAIEALNNEPF